MNNINQDIQASEKIVTILSRSKIQTEGIINDFDSIFVVINEKNEILRANKSFTTIYEMDYLREDFIQAFQEESQGELENLIKATREENVEREVEAYLKDGRLFSLKFKQFPTERKQEGTLVSVSGSDITKLRSTENQMLDIMTTVNLGILFIGQDHKILPGFSNYTKVILEDLDLEDKTIQEVLFDKILNNLTSSESRALLMMQTVFGVSENEFRSISMMLPTKVKIPSALYDDEVKFVTVTYEPVLKNNELDRYMIVLQDVTAAGASNESSFNSDLMELITGINRDPDKYKETCFELSNIYNRVMKANYETDMEAVKGDLHSIKGASRILKLDFVAQIAHEIETQISEGITVEKLTEDLQNLNALWNRIFYVHTALMSSEAGGIKENIFDALEKAPYGHFRNQFKASVLSERETKILQLSQIDEFLEDLVVKNVTDLNYDADYESEIDPILLNSQSYYALKNALMHFTNNSFAHGFDDQDSYMINVKSKIDGEYLLFYFKDDGRGINTEKVREKISEFNPGEDYSKHSESEIAYLIFSPDFSTKDTVDELSGRGIGLNSALMDIRNLGGDITIVEFNKGTEFEIKVPFWPKSDKGGSIVTSEQITSFLELLKVPVENNLKGIIQLKELDKLVVILDHLDKNLKISKIIINEFSDKLNKEKTNLNHFFTNSTIDIKYIEENETLRIELNKKLEKKDGLPKIDFGIGLDQKKVDEILEMFDSDGFDIKDRVKFLGYSENVPEVYQTRAKDLMIDFYLNYYELLLEAGEN